MLEHEFKSQNGDEEKGGSSKTIMMNQDASPNCLPVDDTLDLQDNLIWERRTFNLFIIEA